MTIAGNPVACTPSSLPSIVDKRAFELGEADTESGRKNRTALETLERDLTRNERAALAFIVIDRLTKSASA